MGITPKCTRNDVKRRFDAFLSEIEKQQIRRLRMLGERCVIHARSIPKSSGFEDQTGNLRSSIGYVIFKDGVALHSFYKKVQPKVFNEGVIYNGAEKGEALAKSIGKDKQGICLIVTAGMNYAVYLEAKGRDVLTSAEVLAKQELPRMLNELLANISKAAE